VLLVVSTTGGSFEDAAILLQHRTLSHEPESDSSEVQPAEIAETLPMVL
jgi:hypothetical protein